MNAPISPDRLLATTLDDKYEQTEGWAFLSGTHALVRLALQQRLRDAQAGLNTAGFISGYRGSPLGRFDLELWRNGQRLREAGIHFQPGVNEDLAATAVWGSQYVGSFKGARYDGVFGIWYGKTPGVDRSGDALRHANAAGTSALGGVLALCGDDHGAKSSTQAAQSDYILMATGIPILYPANVQDILDLGLHGIAMSRFSGCWVGFKLVTDVVESASSVELNPTRPEIALPNLNEQSPPDGLSIRAADLPLQQEARLYQHKLPAVLAYARANRLNRIVLESAQPRLGIITAGKSYADTRQALRELGLSDTAASEHGIRLLKLGLVWPLEPEIIREFIRDVDTILVIEEKRPLIEDQLKALLFDLAPGEVRKVVGKFRAQPSWCGQRADAALSAVGELQPAQIAAQIATLLNLVQPPAGVAADVGPRGGGTGPVRMPSFCSGCPHNRSTKVPEGSRALAGIGCHGIAMMQQPGITGNISHMGGEGVMWVGQAPFTDEPHIFANLGDGTYFHSGLLAIRQALSAKAPITYKLLVNGFVSMTGGQPIEGELSVAQMATELRAEGVERIVVVTDDVDRYRAQGGLPAGVPVEPRQRLEAVQRDLREYRGVSVLIYDQMCATERRRLRKRGKYPDPERRTWIHPEVCEGCGDCSTQSNCMSVEPLETELGRKRRINQSTCNKDFSCVEGFCPSFVTLEGARPRAGQVVEAEAAKPVPRNDLPAPSLPSLDARPVALLVTGIGGTGVITIGAILAQAAHLDGLAASTLDLTGLAQKYGAVMSHIRLAQDPGQLLTARLAAGEADVLIGCDLVVSAGDEAISRLAQGRAHAVVNDELTPTSEFLRNPDWRLDPEGLAQRIRDALGRDGALQAIPASRIATSLLGDAIGANMMMLGYAWQQGWIPVSEAAILRAIELNGVAIPLNQQAFAWGRQLVIDPESVLRQLAPVAVVPLVRRVTKPVAEIIEDRADRLGRYQNRRYAERYRQMVEQVVRATESWGDREIAEVVAQQYYRLLAYKDEYEVARLFRQSDMHKQLKEQFEGDFRVHWHLGAWPLARRDPVSGRIVKREVGPWIWPVFGLLSAWRRLRGTWLDPFRNNAERKLALQLLATYEQDVERVLHEGGPDRAALAKAILAWPSTVRGYGHIREQSAAQAEAQRQAHWQQWAGREARHETLAA